MSKTKLALCPWCGKEPDLETVGTNDVKYYYSCNNIMDLERKYNDVKTQVLEINSKFSEGDFAKGISELINLCKQLAAEE